MQNQKQKALVVKQLGKLPLFDDFQIPKPNENQVLIKVIASTINPSDRFKIRGGYGSNKVPFVAGLQGYGEVVEAGKEENKTLIGKKVSFVTYSGSWAQYAVTEADKIWQIDSDVPLQSAASGIVNPLTVIVMVDTYKKWSNFGQKPKGLINTAAASALGRMMNKYCQREGIPLLNIVRRKEQVKILEEEGAKFIIDTSNQNWLDQYKELIKTHGFNVLFDAIGGGQMTQKLISNLGPESQAYIYGKLTTQPFIMRMPLVGLQGTSITGFMMFESYSRLTNEQKDLIKSQFSSLLKNELSTSCSKHVKLEEVPSIWEESEKKATQGKYTIVI